MQIPVPEQLKTVEQKLKLVSANLANAAKQLQNGDIVQPKVIDDIYNELARLNAEKRALESLAAGAGDEALPADRYMADLETVFTALAVDPRTVQNYADAGYLVRNTRGQYDLLASLAAMNKARKDAETSQGDALRDEKIQSVRIGRQKREVELQEKLGTLVNRELVQKAFAKVLVLIRQRFVMMPKYMAPRLDGLSAQEQEPLLEDYARESLAALSAPDLGGVADSGGVQDHGASAEAHAESVGGREKKARKQNKRRAR